MMIPATIINNNYNECLGSVYIIRKYLEFTNNVIASHRIYVFIVR